MLICPKCAFDNELGRIFCHQCGTKLDLNQIKAPSRGGPSLKRRDAPLTAGKIFLRVAEVFLLLIVAWGVYLLCQVPDVKPIASTAADQTSAEKKRFALDRALDLRKPAVIQLSEAEVAAYLNRFGFEKPESKGFRISPTGLQVEFEQGVVVVSMLGQLELGSVIQKKIYVQYRGIPEISREQFTLRPIAAQFGGLPIHPRLLESTSAIQRYFSETFRNLQDDQKLLGRLTSMAAEPRRVTLRYDPSSGTTGAAPTAGSESPIAAPSYEQLTTPAK